MRIFISYSSLERNIIESLYQDLTTLGYIVWYDKELKGGQDWWKEILKEIRACDVCLVTLSPNSLNSEPCRLEREYAHALKRHLLPVEIDRFDYGLLPPFIVQKQIIKFLPNDDNARLNLDLSLKAFPKAPALPKALPPEPPIDTSLYDLQERINAKNLSEREQINLWIELDALLIHPRKAYTARQLLKKLSEHPKVLAQIAKKIQRSLDYAIVPLSPSQRKVYNSLSMEEEVLGDYYVVLQHRFWQFGGVEYNCIVTNQNIFLANDKSLEKIPISDVREAQKSVNQINLYFKTLKYILIPVNPEVKILWWPTIIQAPVDEMLGSIRKAMKKR